MYEKKIPGLFFTVIMGFCVSLCVSGLDLEELAGPEQARALRAGEKPVLAHFDNIRPGLAPSNEMLERLLTTQRQNLGPSVMVETLHIYQKPSGAGRAWTAAEETSIYNGMLALSTLEGIQYFSASRGTMRVFYETSSLIDGPSTKRQIPDPVHLYPPAQLTVYARQRDLTFGDNIYQDDFYSAPGALIFNQCNLSSFYYGIIPVVGKEKLRSTVALFDAGEYILVYISSMAKAASLPGMKDRMRESFANRAEALFRWFTDQADSAYRKVLL
jgi:hypothetical protein